MKMSMITQVEIGAVLIVLANMIWWRTKYLLGKRGTKVSWLTGHLNDYPNLLRAIDSEEDPESKKQLVFQKWLMQSIWVILPVAIALIALPGLSE